MSENELANTVLRADHESDLLFSIGITFIEIHVLQCQPIDVCEKSFFEESSQIVRSRRILST